MQEDCWKLEKQRERIDWVCVSSLGMLGEKEWEEYSGLTELLPISYTCSFMIRMDFRHVVLVWKYIVN
jgi:hypothetical protein